MEKSIKSSAINYGLYLGGSLALITIIMYVINIELMVNFWINLLLLPLLIIGFGVFSTAKSKGINEGFLNFKEAFSSYFITIAIGILISSLLSIILFNFIDPDSAIQLKELAIEKSINMMEGFGAPPEAIAKQVEAMESQDSFSIGTQLWQVAQSLIFFAVIGLIVGAIMKKSNPDA
jgi:hypothetical protein